MSKETGRQLKPAGTRSRIMYGSCKKHKICADECLPFRQILNTKIQACKDFSAYLEPLTTGKYIDKDLLNPLACKLFLTKD